jgi:hypothetical protein
MIKLLAEIALKMISMERPQNPATKDLSNMTMKF